MIKRTRPIRNSGFTLAELLVALMVTSIITTAVVTLSYAMGQVSAQSRENTQAQARLRYTRLKLADLIGHARLICAQVGDDVAIWRGDDNSDNQIQIDELVYLERGASQDYLKLLSFSSGLTGGLDMDDIRGSGFKSLLISSTDETEITLLDDCNNVTYIFDVPPPDAKLLCVRFGMDENGEQRQYEMTGVLRGQAGHLLDSSDDLVSDDD